MEKPISLRNVGNSLLPEVYTNYESLNYIIALNFSEFLW